MILACCNGSLSNTVIELFFISHWSGGWDPEDPWSCSVNYCLWPSGKILIYPNSYPVECSLETLAHKCLGGESANRGKQVWIKKNSYLQFSKTIWSSKCGKQMRLQSSLFNLQSGFNRPVLSSSFSPIWKQERLKTIEEACCRMISMLICPFFPHSSWKDIDERCYMFHVLQSGEILEILLSQTSGSDTVPTTAVPERCHWRLLHVLLPLLFSLLAWALLDFCIGIHMSN